MDFDDTPTLIYSRDFTHRLEDEQVVDEVFELTEEDICQTTQK